MVRCILLLALVTAAFGQSPDTVLTQTLITEIRALRQQIEATTVTSQRVQIALFRMQSQTAVVAAAQQRLDAARRRVAEVQDQRRAMAQEVQAVEERMRIALPAPSGPETAQRKEHELRIPEIRRQIEALGGEESQRRGAEAEAETQFRTEQARLAEFQGLLDRLDKALDELARPKR